MKQLTKRQHELLKAIANSVSEGRHPSTAELLQKVRLSSASALDDLLRPLEDKGFVEVHRPGRGQQRRFDLTSQGRARTGCGIPVLGSIPAGPLQEAVQENDEWIEAPAFLSPRPGDFFLRVAGYSMTGAGIFHNDRVLIRPGVEPRNGEVVAALIVDESTGTAESTLKHLERLDEGRRIRLRAANPDYPDREFDAHCVSVAGVLRGLMREIH